MALTSASAWRPLQQEPWGLQEDPHSAKREVSFKLLKLNYPRVKITTDEHNNSNNKGGNLSRWSV